MSLFLLDEVFNRSMLKELFWILSFANNFFLIAIFHIRAGGNFTHVKQIGYYYLSLIIPTIVGIALTWVESDAATYRVFLILFALYLGLEWILDYKLQIDFRADFSKNWKLLVPYLALYYMMNYGFIVLPWKDNQWLGILLLILFIIQIIENIRSHKK